MPPELLELMKAGGAWAVALFSIYLVMVLVTKTSPEMVDRQQAMFVAALDKTTASYVELTKHQISVQEATVQLIASQLTANTGKLDLLLKAVADMDGGCQYVGPTTTRGGGK